MTQPVDETDLEAVAEDIEFETMLAKDEELVVEDLGRAERSLVALGLWREEESWVKAHAKKEIERIKLWEEIELKRVHKRIGFHELGLFTYLKALKKKSVKLINGTLRSVAGRETVQILDAEKFCEAYPELATMKTTLTPNKNEILKHIKATGEIPEHVDLVKSNTSYKADLASTT